MHAKILVGHKLAADVFEDYMTVDAMFDQLRDPQAKLQQYMLKHMAKDPERALTRLLQADIAGTRFRDRPNHPARHTVFAFLYGPAQ